MSRPSAADPWGILPLGAVASWPLPGGWKGGVVGGSSCHPSLGPAPMALQARFTSYHHADHQNYFDAANTIIFELLVSLLLILVQEVQTAPR